MELSYAERRARSHAQKPLEAKQQGDAQTPATKAPPDAQNQMQAQTPADKSSAPQTQLHTQTPAEKPRVPALDHVQPQTPAEKPSVAAHNQVQVQTPAVRPGTEHAVASSSDRGRHEAVSVSKTLFGGNPSGPKGVAGGKGTLGDFDVGAFRDHHARYHACLCVYMYVSVHVFICMCIYTNKQTQVDTGYSGVCDFL
jgi:hypothetical protein